MPTNAYYIIGGIVVLLVVGFFFWRRRATPSVAMFRAIDDAITRLQRTALTNILPEQPQGTVKGFDPDTMAGQTARLHDTIRFIYTVERHGFALLHIVSSQLLRPKSQKYHIQCMLVVMMVLNRQLDDSGIKQDDVSFDVDQSELGTQFVYMSLSPQQHEQLLERSKSRHNKRMNPTGKVPTLVGRSGRE